MCKSAKCFLRLHATGRRPPRDREEQEQEQEQEQEEGLFKATAMNEVDAGREEEGRRGGEEEGIQSLSSDDGGGEVEEEELFSLNTLKTD